MSAVSTRPSRRSWLKSQRSSQRDYVTAAGPIMGRRPFRLARRRTGEAAREAASVRTAVRTKAPKKAGNEGLAAVNDSA